MSDMGSKLRENNFDVRRLRPWLGEGGKSYVATDEGIMESELKADLTPAQWDECDLQVRAGAMTGVNVVNTMMIHELYLNMTNGPLNAKLPLEEEEMTDADQIILQPTLFQGIPLPFTHSDLVFNRPESMPTLARLAARSVGKELERTTLGLNKTEGGLQIWGLINKAEVCETEKMLFKLSEANYYGPYWAVVGPEVKRTDFFRDDEFVEWIVSPFLPPKGAVVFQPTLDSFRLILGMPPTLVKWTDNIYKVLCIIVPQVRTNYQGVPGIVKNKECDW